MKKTLLFIIVMILNLVLNAQMIVKFNTNLSAGTTITLPLDLSANVTVDWGDGTAVENFTSTGNKDHTYASDGIYTVSISGSLGGYGRCNYPNADKLTEVVSFGNIGLTSLSRAFMNAINLTDVPSTLPTGITTLYKTFYACSIFNDDISNWDVSSVIDMSNMFSNASVFNKNIGSWDVSSVTDMSNMFYNASAFNQDIGNWNVENVTTFRMAFSHASEFNQDLNNWNVSNVENMYYMFNTTSVFNGNISNWDVSSVTDMSSMFSYTTVFNQDLNNWDVSSVTDMSNMFSNASVFNGNISNWDVSSVADMGGMFSWAIEFNQDVSGWNMANVTNVAYMFNGTSYFNQEIGVWNVSNVTSMHGMFANANAFDRDISNWDVGNVTSMRSMFSSTHFNQDISGWDVVNVTDMNSMFRCNHSFNQDISGWNVSNVTDMASMFYGTTQFEQNIGNWDISQVANLTDMFMSNGLETVNYDALLVGWSAQTVLSNLNFHGGNSRFSCAAMDARNSLISDDLWTIIDGGFNDSTLISVQANSQNVVSGDNVSFSVTATGGSLSYQWQKDGVNLTDGGNISGSTSSQLNITNVTGANEGTYHCIVSGICDEIISENVILTVCVITNSTISANTCGSYTSPSGTYTWANSGIYTDVIPNAAGCDSNITINLTIMPSTYSTISEEACNYYTSPSGNNTWTSSGTYTDIIPNAAGCDSSITIDLTIHPTEYIVESEIICQGDTVFWRGNPYYLSGTYDESYTNVNGCDSIYRLYLTVNSIDTSITRSAFTLIANQVGANYQWLYCDSIYREVIGATSRFFTVTENGDYRVLISNTTCSDTSSCYRITGIGVEELSLDKRVSIYPNPAKDYIFIVTESMDINQIELLDISGKLLKTIKLDNTNSYKLDMSDIQKGIYFVKVYSENNFKIEKIILE